MRILKRYLEHKENTETIGEYIERVSKNDEYLLNLIGEYTTEIPTDIRISNAINILDKYQQEEILSQVNDYLNGIERSQDVSVSTTVELNEATVAGKNVFKSFLKLITALGLKSIEPVWDKAPDDYLIYYQYDNVSFEKFKLISNRFKSILSFISNLEFNQNEISLYYGIKNEGIFEYGIIFNNIHPFGTFKLNNTNLSWIKLLDSTSSHSLKKELINLNVNEILLFGKIKSEVIKYKPGNFEKKMNPILKDGVLTFGYYGIGKWEDGKLDQEQFEIIKKNLKLWLSKFKWSEKILVSITSSSFWIYFNVKFK